MPLVKLGIIFAGVVLLLVREWNLGLVLVLASVAVGPLFGYPLLAVGEDVLRTSVDTLTLRLAFSVVMIMTLSELLRETASLKAMVESLEGLIPSGRFVMAALPALVGLLPMVGGAMFSAPMVNEVGDRLEVGRARKTFVNYWFRHIWEYVFPLYPAFVLAAALLGVETLELARAGWPLTAASVVGGIAFGLIGMERKTASPNGFSDRLETLRSLARSIWPIALVIVLSLALPLDERFTLPIGLIVTITLLMTVERIPIKTLLSVLRDRVPWKTVLVLFGALIFRRVLDSSGAVQDVSNTLIETRVPLTLVAFVVPFIAGILTGLSTAAFSIGFPVVTPLVATHGGGMASGWAAWMLGGAFLGVLCSPLHLCLSLTRIYFDASWGPVYRRIVPSSILVALTAGVLLII